ncbi:uncharacterized protein LOC132630930 [Lycium barbarum]|uniref:uncharacterized protein LOC132630930 n=1 Tax=Lycium barbarum TaxID=112863 RepID=UPI00293E6BE9|nr:uncharacterized protein LOC132630930 [Lycium barbarum]
MNKIKTQLEENIFWQVGQGQISFWFDNWTREGALYRLLPDDVKPNNSMLNEVYVNGRWQWNKAGLRVPWEVKLAIQHITINFTPSKKDYAIRAPNTKGTFTISSTWNLLRKRAVGDWHDRRICHKNVSLKTNFHFWRMLKDRLSIDNKIGRFKIHGPSICCCCSNHKIEIVEHLFGQSKVAQDLWAKVCHPLGIKVQDTPLRQILVNCWNSQARNTGQGDSSPDDLLGDLEVKSQFPLIDTESDWLSFCSKLSKNYAKKIIKITKWYPPPPNIIKLNSDGSCEGDECGGGGLIRDDKGRLSFAYSINLGKGTNNWAEAKALQYGVDWCMNKGWYNIVIEVDSLLLVRAIQGKTKVPWNIPQIVKWIQGLLELHQIQIRHCFREANQAADKLAQISHSHIHAIVYNEYQALPRQVRGIINMDRWGLPSIRARPQRNKLYNFDPP